MATISQQIAPHVWCATEARSIFFMVCRETRRTARRAAAAAAIGSALLCNAMAAQAPERFPPLPALPTVRPVEVLLVGVFHFAQQDTSLFEILSSSRQQELDDFVAQVAQFRPTKVMVEWQPYFRQRHIDSSYALHRRGEFALPRNEVYQLGFRLAAAAGLDRVWAIDHPGFWLGDSLRTIAEAMGQTNLLDGGAPHVHPDPADLVPPDSLYARATVGQILRWMSDPVYQALMFDQYVNRLARVGIVAGDDFDLEDNEIGAELLSQWMMRNIKIYRHVLARTDHDARERIVIFIGSDHVQPLRLLFGSNLNFRVVELSDYQ
jgi:hypothetical protein